jgi:hypothetical protein
MEKPKPNADLSLDELIAQAKRTHELIDAVDLEKVACHDPVEINKLASVEQALHAIAEGRAVAHVEGVDDVAPEIDAAQQARAELLVALSDAGWADRIGRVLSMREGQASCLPVDIIPHHQGLPDYEVCISPTDAVGNANFGIFVSTVGIFAASITEPAEKHHWRILRSRPYDNTEELLSAVHQINDSAFE